MDDTKIVSIAIDVACTAKELAVLGIKLLITTHHPLFYNVIANSKLKKFKMYSLSKTSEGLALATEGDAPFAYHIFTKDIIQKAVDEDSIERYHFNLFRALLEKTATFLGYERFDDCLKGDVKNKLVRTLHLNSHGKLSEMESRELSSEDKDIFVTAFNQFTREYKWGK